MFNVECQKIVILNKLCDKKMMFGLLYYEIKCLVLCFSRCLKIDTPNDDLSNILLHSQSVRA